MWVALKDVGCTVDCYHRFSCPCRSRHARRTRERLLDDMTLRGMQEHRPLIPRVIKRPLQLFRVLHNAEAPERVGVLDRACRLWRYYHRQRGSLTNGKIK